MSFLDEVRAKRQKLADILSDDDYSGIREIVEELYPDRAHFIYELLQNAEDTRATEADFVLGTDSLTFEHNGRPFSEADVWGITNIGKGAKRDQVDQIGRFGVGFKAVFAYCDTPYIWSPTFSFRISTLVLPTELASRSDLGQKTRFEFPFNNPRKPSAAAYDEVSAGLEDLAETTLLFLSHLTSIRWRLGDGVDGEVRRVQHSEYHVEVLKRAGTHTIASSHFLRFSQPVEGLATQHVALAFALDCLPKVTVFDQAQPIVEQLKIIPANPGSVAVFFPAEKETSGLRFHLHAPFVPELSRASIKDTAANSPLLHQLANLAAASLHHTRDMGLLSTEFLGVLPNPQDTVPERYQPIRAAIVNAMNTQPLTPTYCRTHAPAEQLFQAKAPLKELLAPGDLVLLADNRGVASPRWAVAAAQKNSNVDRFLTALRITSWDVEALISALKLKATPGRQAIGSPPYFFDGPDPQFMSWLAAKPVEWHQQFYALLRTELQSKPEYERPYRLRQLGRLSIVRLRGGRYSPAESCYFQGESLSEDDDVFPRVDSDVYSSGKNQSQQQDAKSLLKDIGVREVGELEHIEAILRQRYTTKAFHPDLKDTERFVALVEKAPDTSRIFADYYVCELANNKWGQPRQVYVDSPLRDTGLSAFFGGREQSARTKSALSSSYQTLPLAIDRILAFAEAVGVQTRLECERVQCTENPDYHRLVSEAGGGWSCSYGINEDYTIQGIGDLLSQPNEALSRLVWKSACEWKETRWLKARYRNNSNYAVKEADSQLVCILKTRSWVPQSNGGFVRPAEASRHLLPKGFVFDEGFEWLKAVGFGDVERQRLQVHGKQLAVAQALGFKDSNSLERAKQFVSLLPLEDQERVLATFKAGTRSDLPQHEPTNPQRRAEHVTREARSAPDRVTEQRSRSVSVGRDDIKQQASEYLREQYTTADEMICQVCKAPLPFRLADGQHYFEAVELCADLRRHHRQNFLALCPNHSAMFQYVNGSREAMKDLVAEMDGQELEVSLAQAATTIYFTKTHLADLRCILKVEGTFVNDDGDGQEGFTVLR
jgi:hypothetical protein